MSVFHLIYDNFFYRKYIHVLVRCSLFKYTVLQLWTSVIKYFWTNKIYCKYLIYYFSISFHFRYVKFIARFKNYLFEILTHILLPEDCWLLTAKMKNIKVYIELLICTYSCGIYFLLLVQFFAINCQYKQ